MTFYTTHLASTKNYRVWVCYLLTEFLLQLTHAYRKRVHVRYKQHEVHHPDAAELIEKLHKFRSCYKLAL